MITTIDNGNKIFISYRRSSSKWAAAFLYKLLYATHLRKVFLDIADLKGRWRENLFAALRASDYFVVLLCEGTFSNIRNDSLFLTEVREAIKLEKFIVPILQETTWENLAEPLSRFGLEELKEYQSIDLAYQFNGMENCAEAVNIFTTPTRKKHYIPINTKAISEYLDELEDSDYKEAIEDYYRDDYCQICGSDPEKLYDNFIWWSGGVDIEEGEELIEKAGHCNYCNSVSIKCAKCGSITSLFETDDKQSCEGGCGVYYIHSYSKDGEDIVTAFEDENREY